MAIVRAYLVAAFKIEVPSTGKHNLQQLPRNVDTCAKLLGVAQH